MRQPYAHAHQCRAHALSADPTLQTRRNVPMKRLIVHYPVQTEGFFQKYLIRPSLFNHPERSRRKVRYKFGLSLARSYKLRRSKIHWGVYEGQQDGDGKLDGGSTEDRIE